MTELARQRVRDVLKPFMDRFEFDVEPGASDSQIADVCRRLPLDVPPDAVAYPATTQSVSAS
jgi:hypothetical protein